MVENGLDAIVFLDDGPQIRADQLENRQTLRGFWLTNGYNLVFNRESLLAGAVREPPLRSEMGHDLFGEQLHGAQHLAVLHATAGEVAAGVPRPFLL